MTVCDCEQRCRGRAAAGGSVERRTLSPGPGSQSGAVSEAPTAAASSRSRRHSRRHPTAAGRAAPTGLRGSGVRGVPRRLFPRTASRGCLPAQGDGPVRPGYHIGACQWRTRMADRGLRRGRTVLLRGSRPGSRKSDGVRDGVRREERPRRTPSRARDAGLPSLRARAARAGPRLLAAHGKARSLANGADRVSLHGFL